MALVEIYDGGGVGDYDNVVDFDINYIDDKEVDKATFKVYEFLDVEAGDEIKFYDEESNLQFRGKCKEKNPLDGDETGLYELVCYTYDIELTEQTVDDVFQNIALESLIETIVTTYSSLAFSTTVSTGIIVNYYNADKKYAWDVVKQLLNLSKDLTYYINYTTNTFVLIKRGDLTSSITLENGTNCIFNTGWRATTDKQVTRLNLIGGKDTNYGYTETFSGNGSTTQFTTQNIFNNIKITVGGVSKTLQVTGQNTGDYTIVQKDKTIDFLSAPASGTDNISVTYDFEMPIDLRGVDADPSYITQYGIIEKEIVRPHLKDTDDAIQYALEYVNKFAKPLYSNVAEIISTLDARSIIPGSKVYVIDDAHTIEGVTIADYYIINGVQLNGEGIKITVGDIRSDILDFIKEMKYQVEQLEQNNTNSTITTKVQTMTSSAIITFTPEIVSMIRRTWDADTFYLDEDGAAAWNQMKDDGTGPIMRDTGGYTDEPIFTTFITTESSDALTTEAGDNIIFE